MLAGMVQGTHLASGSGDSSVKLWSFEQQRCVATYSDHTQAVWGVAFHDLGDFVASCSLDHSTRLWDITTSRCRQSFRCGCQAEYWLVVASYGCSVLVVMHAFLCPFSDLAQPPSPRCMCHHLCLGLTPKNRRTSHVKPRRFR